MVLDLKVLEYLVIIVKSIIHLNFYFKKISADLIRVTKYLGFLKIIF
jgi:hypothetical protein